MQYLPRATWVTRLCYRCRDAALSSNILHRCLRSSTRDDESCMTGATLLLVMEPLVSLTAAAGSSSSSSGSGGKKQCDDDDDNDDDDDINNVNRRKWRTCRT